MNNLGWQCPACHKCYSPEVKECCCAVTPGTYVWPPTPWIPSTPEMIRQLEIRDYLKVEPWVGDFQDVKVTVTN